MQEVCDSISGSVKSNTVSSTARHCCDVALELYKPGAKPRRWAPPLVTRFGAYREYNEDFLLLLCSSCLVVGAYPGGGAGAAPPPADKCTKLSWCKGDIRIKDNLRA